MKIAIPKIPQKKSDKITIDTNANRKSLNKEHTELRENKSESKTMRNILAKKQRHESTSNSSCCSDCTESDDSDSSSLCSKNKLTPKSLKHNANNKIQKNGNSIRRNATKRTKKALVDTSDSDSSDESSDSEPNEKRSPLPKTKQSYKNDFLKSTTSNQNLNADGASSSDMEIPALVRAAIQCVESSDGENMKIEQNGRTQYTSSLLRDFVAKTQMMGSSISNSNDVLSPKGDAKQANDSKSNTKSESQESADKNVKRRRGRPRKNPLPNSTETAHVNNGSPDSGIISTPQSPVPSSKSSSTKSSKKPTTVAAKKIDIALLEKSMYATERVLYPPRRKSKSVTQRSESNSRSRDSHGTAKVDPVWQKLDFNKKFRRPSECGYRSDTNTICSKVLAAQSGYNSDYCNVSRRILSGYKSDYSCKSRRSGYKSDCSLKAKSCGYRSDCSTRHRRKVRRKRRTKTASTKPTINDQDILMLAGLSLGQSDDSSDESSDKPQITLKSSHQSSKRNNLISNTVKKSTSTKVPAQKSTNDDVSSNQSERTTKHKNNGNFDSMLLSLNDSMPTITSSIYKDDLNSLKLDRMKPGLIRRRRSSAVSHCSSHCSTNSRHPFRRRRRRRLKSTADHVSEPNLAKINQQIDLLTSSFTSLCTIFAEKPTRDKEKTSQTVKSTGSRRTSKKRKINQENTEVPTVNTTTTSKRRNKKTVQTKSPDDHKLPLKKRHYLLTPGEKSESVNADEKDKEQTEPDNETDISGKAITPKKRHLLQTPVDLNDVIDSTDATSNSTCKDLQEIQASVSVSITGDSVSAKNNSHSKKNVKKSRTENVTAKATLNTQSSTELNIKTSNSVKNTTPRSKALTTKSTTASKNPTSKSLQILPTVPQKSKQTINTPSFEPLAASKSTNSRLNSARNSKTETNPPPGVFEPSIDLELQIPFTEIPIPIIAQKSNTESNRTDLLKSKAPKNHAKKTTTDEGVVEKLLHRIAPAMKIGKKKRKKPNRTGFPTLKKKKKAIIKLTDFTMLEAEGNAILEPPKKLTSEPKIILNCVNPKTVNKLSASCDRVPSEGEPTGIFIERNSTSLISIASSDRQKGKLKSIGKKAKVTTNTETKQSEVIDKEDITDSKVDGKRLKHKEIDTKSKAKQKENAVEVITPRRSRLSTQKDDSITVPSTKIAKTTKSQTNSKENLEKTAPATVKSTDRNAKQKTVKSSKNEKEAESSKSETLTKMKKSSNDNSKSENNRKRTVNGRIISSRKSSNEPAKPEKDDEKHRKRSRRDLMDENKSENQKRLRSPSIPDEPSVIEKKRTRTELPKSPTNKEKIQPKSKIISKETITDINDIVPVDNWAKPMNQDPLPEEENINYSDESSNSSIQTIDTKKSNSRSKKKYLVAGLFSNFYKTNVILPSDKSKNSTSVDKKVNDDEQISESLLPMPFFDKYLLQTQIDFSLPYDLWFAHENDKLSGRNVVHSWNFKKIRTNVYADSVKPIQSPDLPQCSCKTEYECGDNCLNRLVYTECVPETCPCGDKCQNTKIQKHIVAPVERFMTISKGWGVRSNALIKKGTYILEYVGEVVSEREFKERMATLYINDIHHYCLHLEGGLFIDGHRMGSDCRFVNHSCEPNCEMQKWSVNGYPRMALFASRDIKTGEELTYDYNFSLFNVAGGQDCKCESNNCRGVIGGKSQRIRPIENKVSSFEVNKFVYHLFHSLKNIINSFNLFHCAERR